MRTITPPVSTGTIFLPKSRRASMRLSPRREWYTLTVVNDYGAKTSAVYLTGERFGNGGKFEVAPLGERVFLGTYDFRNATAGDPDVFEMAIGSGKAGTSFTVDYIRSYAVKEDA